MVARLTVPPELEAKYAEAAKKVNPDELVAQAKALIARLREGSTELGPEGAAAMSRVDPETSVGLDAAMEAGWEPRQDLGASPGNDRLAFPHWRSGIDPEEAGQKAWNFTKDNNPDAAPLRGYEVRTGRGPEEARVQAGRRHLDDQTVERMRAGDASALAEYRRRSDLRLGAADRTRAAAESIRDRYGERLPSVAATTKETYADPKLQRLNPHPDLNRPFGETDWNLNENIPGLAAGTSAAAAAAYALAPGQAQAAPPQGQMTQGQSIKQVRDAYVNPERVDTLEKLANAPDKAAGLAEYLKSKGFNVSTTGEIVRLAYNASPLAAVGNLAQAAELLVHPAVRYWQDNAGRPMVEKFIDTVLPKVNAADEAIASAVFGQPMRISEEDKAARELSYRNLGTLIGGPGLMEDAPDRVKEKGVKGIEAKMGSTLGAAYLAAGQQVAELPLFLVGAGKWLQMGEAAAAAPGLTQGTKALLKGAGHVLAGVQGGVATAAFLPPREGSDIAPGMTFIEGAVGGGLLGGFFSVLGEAIGAVRKLKGKGKSPLFSANPALERDAREAAANARADARINAFFEGRRAERGLPTQEWQPLTSEQRKSSWYKVGQEAATAAKARVRHLSSLTGGGDMRAQATAQPRTAPSRRKLALAEAPTVAFLTPEAVRQMEAEVVRFPGAKPAQSFGQKWFGTAYVHNDPKYGPSIFLVEQIDANGVPAVKVVPLTDANAVKLRGISQSKPLSSGEGLFTYTPEGLAWVTNNEDRDAQAIRRILQKPAPRNFSEKQEAWLKGFEAMQPESKANEVLVGDMSYPDSGDLSLEVKLLPDGTLDARPVRMGQSVKPDDVRPTVFTDLHDMFGNTVQSRSERETELAGLIPEQERTQVPLGGMEPQGKTGPRVQNPTVDVPAIEQTSDNMFEATKSAQVEDLRKLGFKPGGGIGGGSYKGGNPDKIPVGFLGEGGSKTGGGGRGPPPPQAPRLDAGPPPPPSLPPSRDQAPEDYATLDEALDMVKRNLGRDVGLFQKIHEGLVSTHLRGPTAWAAFKTSYQASQVLQRSSEELQRAMQKRFGKELLSSVDRKLDAWFKGRTTWAQVQKELPPEVQEEARRFAMELFNERQILDQKLRDLGVTPENHEWLRDAGLEDLYMARRYLLYALPEGRWAKTLRTDSMQGVLRDGVDYIYQQMKKVDKTITPDEVMYEVLELLKERDPLAAIKNGSTRLSPLKSLIARGEVPAPIRKLLGEVESGMFNIANSLGTQRSLVARYQLLSELAADPGNWSLLPNEATKQTYRVPQNNAFGAMAGKYVTRDILEGIGSLPKAEAMSHRFLSDVLGFVKGNQTAMGGLGPLLNSTFGNLWSGLLSGGLDPINMGRSGRAGKAALQAMVDHYKDPSGTTGLGWLVNEARQYGADFFGFSHEEVGNPFSRQLVKDWEKILPKAKDGDLMSIWRAVNENTFQKYRHVQEQMGRALDANDRFFRLQSYIALREKYLTDFVKNGADSELVREGLLSLGTSFNPKTGANVASPVNLEKIKILQGVAQKYIDGGLPKNVSAEAVANMMNDPLVKEVLGGAAKMSARRINQSFWNPTFIGKPLDELRKSGVGVVAPYATAAFETARINGMLPRRLFREKDLRWRLLAGTAMVGAAVGANGLLAQYNGISKEEADAARDSIPDRKTNYRPWLVPMMWRDDKGRIQFWDVTRQFDLLRYFSGNPADGMARNFFANLLLSPVEGGGGEGPARELANASGLIRDIVNKQGGFKLSQPETEKLMQFAFNRGLAPGLARSMYMAARDSDLIGGRPRLTEQLTPAQAAVKAMGISNIQPVGPTTARAQRVEDKGFMKQVRSEMRGVQGSSLDAEDKADRKERLREEKDKFKERRRQRSIFRGSGK